MTWKSFLASKTVQAHTTSIQEIRDLRELVDRDLKDAAIESLSDDRRFATAYNAVLQLSKMAIACAGYRVPSGAGHHQKTFDAVRIAVDSAKANAFADYFDTCRRKRNKIDYDRADIVTETESNELLQKASEFRELIEAWIRKKHPRYEL